MEIAMTTRTDGGHNFVALQKVSAVGLAHVAA